MDKSCGIVPLNPPGGSTLHCGTVWGVLCLASVV